MTRAVDLSKNLRPDMALKLTPRPGVAHIARELHRPWRSLEPIRSAGRTRMPLFKLRFDLADIPKWSADYSYDGSDARFLAEVRPAVQRRGYLTATEFRDICYWKTPRSLSLCRRNTRDEIRVLTQAALATDDEALKMAILRLLHGVEWPTASTLLHFCDQRPYPILDYRALWSLGYSRPPHYTMPFWLGYVGYVRELVRRSRQPMRTVDRALWQYSKARQR